MSRLKRASDEQVPMIVPPLLFFKQPFVPEVPTRISPKTYSLSVVDVVPMLTLPPESCKTTLPEAEAERMYQPPVVPKWMWLKLAPMLGAEKVAVLSPALVEEAETVRRAGGAVVPMPTLVSAVARLMPLMAPRISELLCVTEARAPMAVPLLTPELTLVL